MNPIRLCDSRHFLHATIYVIIFVIFFFFAHAHQHTRLDLSKNDPLNWFDCNFAQKLFVAFAHFIHKNELFIYHWSKQTKMWRRKTFKNSHQGRFMCSTRLTYQMMEMMMFYLHRTSISWTWWPHRNCRKKIHFEECDKKWVESEWKSLRGSNKSRMRTKYRSRERE